MKIYGSTTSPYVRRLRLLLEGQSYQFHKVNLMDEKDRKLLADLGPIKKVPILEDGETVLYESRVIFNYLQQKLAITKNESEKENTLSIIDALSDSLVIILQLKWSDVPFDESKLIFKLQKERIIQSLEVLEEMVSLGKFSAWDYQAMCLYCLIDWILFREVWNLTEYESLQKFHATHREKEVCQMTDPRL
ncbi:glutathione S-transferase family protein [Halobacteriovorax sp. GB3]|uniref:glutathione S-transferase family protein n=1 Tax=Halobacteriovorax sp. GB3 TaxID=2719615 RepID=UPI00235EFBC6|nr:glutathione S-transferase family protein [Halobacteriovorax sp. GB3]MDD0851855.1 glutathione S-transferase family protein [Halobacteriovorax sp. GB3]